MLREPDSVVLSHDHSSGSRIPLRLYPNGPRKSRSDGAAAQRAAGLGADAGRSSAPPREETPYAV
jgi:hypothetical protein